MNRGVNLDADTCFRALATRDERFDGVFFVGVRTTGIYCRPVCRARTPGADRCRFYLHAAEAERDGFRACFRCRPELAPGSASVDAVPRIAAAAVARIEAGALNEGSLDDLARELGVTSRHIRRAVQTELGLSPVELAQSRRLALAKQLLHDTRMPMAEIAFASGFASVRRFNAAFHARYGRAPSSLRRDTTTRARETIAVRLDFRPPLDWDGLLGFFAARATPGVESVRGDVWLRTARAGAHRGWVSVTPIAGRPALRAEISSSLAPALMEVVARLRRVFDLDAQPRIIAAHLAKDRRLAASVRARPGLRVPGSFEGFDAAVRAILGQQVSVAAATTLSGRLAAAFGEPIATPHGALVTLAPSASRLAAASETALSAIGLTRARAATLRGLSRAVVSGALRLDRPAPVDATLEALLALPGIGDWTAQYIAMRALGWPDAFPAGDLGIRKALGMIPAKAARELAERWRPWRAYAALHLWSTLSKGTR